jgi:hypothetical protein
LRIGGAIPPVALSNAAFCVIDSTDDPAADAARLREAIDSVWRTRAERNVRPGRRRASLGAQAAINLPRPPSRARRLATRSAIGLVATLAVVGAAAPMIVSGRSTNETDRPEPAADQTTRVSAAETAPHLVQPEPAAAAVERAAASATIATVRSASADTPDPDPQEPAPAPSSLNESDAADEAPETDPEAELPAPEDAAATKGAPSTGSRHALVKERTKSG